MTKDKILHWLALSWKLFTPVYVLWIACIIGKLVSIVVGGVIPEWVLFPYILTAIVVLAASGVYCSQCWDKVTKSKDY